LKQQHLSLCIVVTLFLTVTFNISCNKNSAPNPQNPVSGVKPVVNTTALTAQPAPTIVSLNPASGIYNSKFTITGTHFSTDMLTNLVYINGIQCNLDPTATLTSTRMTVIVPFKVGTGNIRVVVNGQGGDGPVFTYKPSPIGVVTTLAGFNSKGVYNGTFISPLGLAVDSLGNVFVADEDKDQIIKVTKNGVASVYAGSGNLGSANGHGTAASFALAEGVAIDPARNLYISDSGGAIRLIAPGGYVSTLLKMAHGPVVIARDAKGNLYVSFAGEGYQIVKVSPNGAVTPFAGSGLRGSDNGLGAKASFAGVSGLAVDGAGNVFVADLFNNLIRKITPAGLVSTFAGSGVAGSADGLGKAASFNNPSGVATDAAGNVYVTDTGNLLIRKIRPGGKVTTFDYKSNTITLDGGFGPRPFVFSGPVAIAVDATGNNIYISDQFAGVLRKIRISML
jgi:hypothetical protein